MVNSMKCLFGLCLMTLSIYAPAHQMSTAYITLQHSDTELTGEWQIRWTDLDLAIGLDTDGDNTLRWGEVQKNTDRIMNYLQSHLFLGSDNRGCDLTFSPDIKHDSHMNEGYLWVSFNTHCPPVKSFSLSYSAMFDFDQDHKAILNVESPDGASSYVLSAQEQIQQIQPNASSAIKTFSTYLQQGVIHIWMGIDHILFLIALLLTSVLTRKDRRWHADISAGQVVRNTLWIVTAFTLAHSLTLTATAMNWLNFSSRWVEVGIAISVLLTAINNIWPMIIRLGWITFAFGLLHGMGFASVLMELGLSSQHRLISILAFNLGVEIGQLAILIILIPVLLSFRYQNWYKNYGMKIASAAIGVIAVFWTVQRL